MFPSVRSYKQCALGSETSMMNPVSLCETQRLISSWSLLIKAEGQLSGLQGKTQGHGHGNGLVVSVGAVDMEGGR